MEKFEEWLESEATKEFRGLLAFDRMAKKLAEAAWLASKEAVEHRLHTDAGESTDFSGVLTADSESTSQEGS